MKAVVLVHLPMLVLALMVLPMLVLPMMVLLLLFLLADDDAPLSQLQNQMQLSVLDQSVSQTCNKTSRHTTPFLTTLILFTVTISCTKLFSRSALLVPSNKLSNVQK